MSMRRNKRTFADVHRFLDLEAGDGSESDKDSNEGSDDDDFIASATPITETESRPVLRWDEFDTAEDLEALAQDIRRRARGANEQASAHTHDDNPALPTDADPGVWRVRVQDGRECDVVFAIFQLSLADPSKGILTACMRDHTRGAVYIEARSLTNVLKALQGVGGVIHNRNGPLVDFVPVSERTLILHKRNVEPMQNSCWVRITRRGKYHHNLGLTKEVDHTSYTAIVLVLSVSRNRKHHKRTPDNIPKPVLSEIKLSIADISSDHVNATEDELDAFYHTDDGFVKQALGTYAVALRAGDRVEVNSGTFTSAQGHIDEVHDDGTISLNPDTSLNIGEVRDLRVRADEVRKKFLAGDFIRVIVGKHRNAEGFIVQFYDECAVIYNVKEATQVEVNILHIDWSGDNPKVNACQSHIKAESAQEKPPANNTITRNDPYRHMEVRITHGGLKGTYGDVISSWERDGKVYIEVGTVGLAQNTRQVMQIDHVIERFTGMPLERARWVPNRSQLKVPPPEGEPRPKTPPYFPPDGDTTFTLPPDIEESLPEPVVPSRPLRPGEWLLDERLLNKRLDIRVKGTTSYYNGKYENSISFVTLNKKPSSVEESIVVRLGFNQSQRKFKLYFLFPEMTTENPRYVEASQARPVVSSPGQRVVIIGADIQGDNALVGNFGDIMLPHCPIPKDQACVLVKCNSQSLVRYFGESSLCRSLRY